MFVLKLANAACPAITVSKPDEQKSRAANQCV